MGAPRVRSVFISYRRDAAHGHAQTFYRAFGEVLGARRVFLDVGEGHVPAGADWRAAVTEAMERVDVVLLLVDPELKRRLRDPSDAMAFEVRCAMEQRVRVVPVRVEGAEPFGTADVSSEFAFLVDANAPAVRPDSSVTDVNRIVKELTGYAPGELAGPDRWDLIATATVCGVGFLGWLSWGRSVFSLHEQWLWGSTLLLPILAWWFVRRAIHFPPSTTGRSRTRYVSVRAVVVAALMAAWALAASRQYRVPTLTGDSGVLLARFDGDPDNLFQRDFADLLRDEAKPYAKLNIDLEVALLPRRLGDEQAARRYGEESGAGVVLWGRARSAVGDSVGAVMHVLFLHRPGLFQKADGGAIEGWGLLGPQRLETSTAFDTLRTVLPGLLAGYQLYERSQADSAALDLSASVLDETLSTAEGQPQGALEDVLAMLHFLRGNVWLLDAAVHAASAEDGQRVNADLDSAGIHYSEAIGHSLLGRSDIPTYIEPLNNLSYIYVRRHQYDRALVELNKSDDVCLRGEGSSACPYAAYHKGAAFAGKGDFARASEIFTSVIEDSVNASNPALVASAYQYRGFSAARQAAIGDDSIDDEELLSNSEEDLSSAVLEMRAHGLEPPRRWVITKARIAIERGNWRQALDTLDVLMHELPDEPDPYALAAAVTTCMSPDDADAGMLLLNEYAAREPPSTVLQGIDEYDRITGRCVDK